MFLIYLWSWNKVQSHQTWNGPLDTEQGYNHAKFERPPLYSVPQNAYGKVFVKLENMSIISLDYLQKCKTVTYSLSTYLTMLLCFNLIR